MACLQALIEKDWLNFGHKFMDRCGHIQGKEDEVSPTFVQFLDCVWQLTEMFPTYFQVILKPRFNRKIRQPDFVS